MTIITCSDAQTREIGERIGSRLRSGDILLLEGPLGAGKTTLAKGIARGLGVEETVTSPTYTIVSEYIGRLALHHIDLYRISSEEEFLQLGLDDMLYGDGVSLIEWPERAGDETPVDAVSIRIRIRDEGAREVSGPDELLAGESLGRAHSAKRAHESNERSITDRSDQNPRQKRDMKADR